MANKNQEKLSILRRKQVMDRTGLTRSTMYLRIQEGTFPKPVGIGPRAVGWPSDEIDSINAARIAGKTDEEIIILVAKLEVARKTAK